MRNKCAYFSFAFLCLILIGFIGVGVVIGNLITKKDLIKENRQSKSVDSISSLSSQSEFNSQFHINNETISEKRFSKFLNESNIKKLRESIKKLQLEKNKLYNPYHLKLEKDCTPVDNKIHKIFRISDQLFEDPPTEDSLYSYEIKNCCCCKIIENEPHYLKYYGTEFPNCIQCCDFKINQYDSKFGLVNRLSIRAITTILG